jgi:hypothetical protein
MPLETNSHLTIAACGPNPALEIVAEMPQADNMQAAGI